MSAISLMHHSRNQSENSDSFFCSFMYLFCWLWRNFNDIESQSAGVSQLNVCFLIVEGYTQLLKPIPRKNRGHDLSVLSGGCDPDNGCHCLDVILQPICFCVKVLNGLCWCKCATFLCPICPCLTSAEGFHPFCAHTFLMLHTGHEYRNHFQSLQPPDERLTVRVRTKTMKMLNKRVCLDRLCLESLMLSIVLLCARGESCVFHHP